jgi:hypothetical protein
MKRKRTIDRPLLAGRFKPYRRPPQAGPRDSSLRLQSSGGDRHLTVGIPANLGTAIERAESVGQSLHAALEGYSRILTVVGNMEDALRLMLNDNARPGLRVVSTIAELLSKIDAEAHGVCDAGRRLLDGCWRAELIDVAGNPTFAVTLPQIASDSLGSQAVGGRLSSLTTVATASPAKALAIVRSAVLWLAGERERLFRILADVVEPHVAELETIEANCSAATATDQADFAADLAAITKLHALAALQSINARQPAKHHQPNDAGSLRIRHHDDD